MSRGTSPLLLATAVLLGLAGLPHAFVPSFTNPYRLATSHCSSAPQLARTVVPLGVRRHVKAAPPVTMLFDELAGKLSDVLGQMRGSQRITENNIGAALKTVRRSLLDADVNIGVVNGLVEAVKEKALGLEVIEGVKPGDQFVKVMYDELVKTLGSEPATLTVEGKAGQPAVVLLAGLQGAGKTTAAAKLAQYTKRKLNKKVMLVAADTYRPAAREQLRLLGERVGVEVFIVEGEESAVAVAKAGIAAAKEKGVEVVIIDTQGRQVVDEALMNELVKIERATSPVETLLVIDAMTGQQAADIASQFNKKVGLTGTILTKLDGDSRGGAALSVLGVSGKPIKLTGVGEGMGDLEQFYPERMASRILGMGDVLSFVEKAQEQMDEDAAEAMNKKMMSATFNFDDFLEQMRMINKMGSVQGMMSMIPGMAGRMSESQLLDAQKKLRNCEKIIGGMDDEERGNPELLISDKSSLVRISRISDACGATSTEVRNFLGEFQSMRVMMRRMGKKMADGGEEPGDAGDVEALMGNRAERRAKKKGKGGKQVGAAKGFGR